MEKISKIIIKGVFLYYFSNLLYPQAAAQVILTIEDHEIPVKEYIHFLDQYDPDKIQTNRYNAAKFTDYQLKLYEARRRGCDTTQTYLSDLQQYREYISQDYLNYDRLDPAQIEEYYQRSLKELEISHILIRISGDIYSDTMAAYNKIYSLRQQIINGADFNSIAFNYSQASSAKDSGYMSFVGGMEMNFPLEEFAFKTPVGSVSQILRTSTAYHLLKVHKERARLELQSGPGNISNGQIRPKKSRAEIKEFYMNNPSRKNYLHDKFLRDVMGKFGFSFDNDAYQQFVEYGHTSFQEGKWIEPIDLIKDKILFTIGDQDISYSDFSQYLSKQQFAYSFINYPPVIGKHFQEFFFQTIHTYQDQHLETGYPEFASKMNLYSSALLSSCIEDHYWEETSSADSLLREYYFEHIEKYSVAEDGSIAPFREVLTDVIIDYYQATEGKRISELRARYKHQFHRKAFRKMKKAMCQI